MTDGNRRDVLRKGLALGTMAMLAPTAAGGALTSCASAFSFGLLSQSSALSSSKAAAS